jgi:hypothetical protein
MNMRKKPYSRRVVSMRMLIFPMNHSSATLFNNGAIEDSVWTTSFFRNLFGPSANIRDAKSYVAINLV